MKDIQFDPTIHHYQCGICHKGKRMNANYPILGKVNGVVKEICQECHMESGVQ